MDVTKVLKNSEFEQSLNQKSRFFRNTSYHMTVDDGQSCCKFQDKYIIVHKGL